MSIDVIGIVRHYNLYDSQTSYPYSSYLRVDNDEDAIGGTSIDRDITDNSMVSIDDGYEPIKVLSADQSGLRGNVKEIFIFPGSLRRYNAPGEPWRCTINFHLPNSKMKKQYFTGNGSLRSNLSNGSFYGYTNNTDPVSSIRLYTKVTGLNYTTIDYNLDTHTIKSY